MVDQAAFAILVVAFAKEDYDGQMPAVFCKAFSAITCRIHTKKSNEPKKKLADMWTDTQFNHRLHRQLDPVMMTCNVTPFHWQLLCWLRYPLAIFSAFFADLLLQLCVTSWWPRCMAVNSNCFPSVEHARVSSSQHRL